MKREIINEITNADLDVALFMFQLNKYSKGIANIVKVASIDIQIKAGVVASKVDS